MWILLMLMILSMVDSAVATCAPPPTYPCVLALTYGTTAPSRAYIALRQCSVRLLLHLLAAWYHAERLRTLARLGA
jgi:hypothetical protein